MSRKYLLLTAALGLTSARADVYIGDEFIERVNSATEEAYKDFGFLKARVVADCAEQYEAPAPKKGKGEESSETEKNDSAKAEAFLGKEDKPPFATSSTMRGKEGEKGEESSEAETNVSQDDTQTDFEDTPFTQTRTPADELHALISYTIGHNGGSFEQFKDELKKIQGVETIINAQNRGNRTPLIQVIEEKKIALETKKQMIDLLLAKGANVAGVPNQMPLAAAAYNGEQDLFDHVLTKVDESDLTPEEKQVVLANALNAVVGKSSANPDILKKLFLRGVTSNLRGVTSSSGYNGFHYAVERGDMAFLQEMIKIEKANELINQQARSTSHGSPLALAVMENKKDFVKILLENGAEVTTETVYVKGGDSFSLGEQKDLFWLVFTADNLDIANLFIKKIKTHPQKEALFKKALEAADYVQGRSIDKNYNAPVYKALYKAGAVGKSGSNGLFWAIKNEDLTFFNEMLKTDNVGAMVNSVDSPLFDPSTPLQLLLGKAEKVADGEEKKPYYEAIKALIVKGAKGTFEANNNPKRITFDWTALPEDLVEQLFEIGALGEKSVNNSWGSQRATTMEGLVWAVSNDKEALFNKLLDQNPSAAILQEAFTTAVQKENPVYVDALLGQDVNINGDILARGAYNQEIFGKLVTKLATQKNKSKVLTDALYLLLDGYTRSGSQSSFDAFKKVMDVVPVQDDTSSMFYHVLHKFSATLLGGGSTDNEDGFVRDHISRQTEILKVILARKDVNVNFRYSSTPFLTTIARDGNLDFLKAVMEHPSSDKEKTLGALENISGGKEQLSEQDMTQLQHAYNKAHKDVKEYLLEQGAKDKDGKTILRLRAEAKNWEGVLELLEQGQPQPEEAELEKVLAIACDNLFKTADKDEVSQKILYKLYENTKKEAHPKPYLHFAVKVGDAEKVEYLLKEVDASTKEEGKDLLNKALKMAANNEGIVKLLTTAGAKFTWDFWRNLFDRVDLAAVEGYKEVIQEWSDKDKIDPLSAALSVKNLEIAGWVLNMIGSVPENVDARTLYTGFAEGRFGVRGGAFLKNLLAKCPLTNVKWELPDCRNPLVYKEKFLKAVLEMENQEVLETVLQQDTDFANLSLPKGTKPVVFCAKKEQYELARVLIKAGAIIGLATVDGEPLKTKMLLLDQPVESVSRTHHVYNALYALQNKNPDEFNSELETGLRKAKWLVLSWGWNTQTTTDAAELVECFTQAMSGENPDVETAYRLHGIARAKQVHFSKVAKGDTSFKELYENYKVLLSKAREEQKKKLEQKLSEINARIDALQNDPSLSKALKDESVNKLQKDIKLFLNPEEWKMERTSHLGTEENWALFLQIKYRLKGAVFPFILAMSGAKPNIASASRWYQEAGKKKLDFSAIAEEDLKFQALYEKYKELSRNAKNKQSKELKDKLKALPDENAGGTESKESEIASLHEESATPAASETTPAPVGGGAGGGVVPGASSQTEAVATDQAAPSKSQTPKKKKGESSTKRKSSKKKQGRGKR